MMSYLNQLNERERLLLMIAVPLLVIVLSYAIVWRPFSSHVEELQQRVERQQEVLQYMHSAARQVKQLRRQQALTSRSGANQSLLALVDRTVKQAKLARALKRVEPDGADKVKVRLEGAGFDDMIGWLESLQQRYTIAVEDISIDVQDDPGTVNARLTLFGASR
jgi:general secretion pathway protein M